jgi:hypothetical protein
MEGQGDSNEKWELLESRNTSNKFNKYLNKYVKLLKQKVRIREI